ncbi:class I SAM-dependent methyltransferase [Azospirillum sp.]|uniref:class I SAM-dependent methyltransferase n=1 Tax=Azospirillum sp. TaxID=34012 RepID=UPI003D739CDC
MISLPLALVLPWGILDTAQIDPLGLVRLVGWSQQPTWTIEPPRLALDDRALQHTAAYRFARPDVPPGDGQLVPQAGLVLEYRLVDGFGGDPQALTSVRIGDRDFPLDARVGFVEPHYGTLFDTERVLTRDDIYGFGPPNPEADPEVAELVAGTEGPVLDFGCGSGALVRAMRGRGLDARGLEIDREPVRQALRPDVAPYVTLYAGDFPSPYGSGAFDTVIASEVLEHIPDHAAAISEMARLTRRRLILTVPDIAAIPLGTRHRLVPWHLLESTHVNFFNQRSLGRALAPFFPKVEFGRISPCALNDTAFYVSLVAVCSK